MPINIKLICQKPEEDLVTDWMWGLRERSERPLMFQACKGPCTEEESKTEELPPAPTPPLHTHREVLGLPRRERNLRSLENISVYNQDE